MGTPTKDHLFPASWYPSTTPPTTQRPTVPSCPACNARMGKIEDRLRLRLPLALDPGAPAAQGLVESVHRAVSPAAGRDARDQAARAATLKRLLDSALPATEVPMDSVLPGLGPHAGTPFEEQVATTVRAEDLHAFIEKLVRGTTYLDLQVLIDDRYVIHVQPVDPRDAGFLKGPLARFGRVRDLGPGLSLRVARVPEDPVVAIYEFVLWDRLTMYAIVQPKPTIAAATPRIRD